MIIFSYSSSLREKSSKITSQTPSNKFNLFPNAYENEHMQLYRDISQKVNHNFLCCY